MSESPREDEASASDEARALRALRVLGVVTESSLPISLSQLGARTRIPKATLARLVAALVSGGHLSRLPGKRDLVPGPATVRLGALALGNGQFRRECRAILRSVVNRVGETCNLTVRDGDNVMYVERVEADHMLRLHLEPGTRAPMHCTAGGKLFLSQLGDEEQARLLPTLTLRRMTPATIVRPEALGEELRRLRKLGIGLDDEEFVAGMVGIAVPVFSPQGDSIAALVCHAAAARMSLEKLKDQLPFLRATAKTLGARLG